MYIDNYIDPKPKRSLLYGEKSIGIVVKTPEEIGKDDVIGVYIPRMMFGLTVAEGAYEKDVSFDTKKILNSSTKSIGKSKFKSRNYVELPIIQIGNSVSPKFVLGENVFIECCDRDIKNSFVLPFSFGEQAKRKDDRITLLCPNLKEFGESKNLDIENSYGIQIDTKTKILSIWTSCEGGGETGSNEKGKYYIGINPAEGEILISDNGKRTLTLNTDDDRWTMMNEAGSKIEMAEDTINIYAPSTINIEADDEINIKSSKLNREHDDISTSSSTDTEEVDTLEIKGSKLTSTYDTTKIESKSYENKTNKWKTDSPISGFTKILTSDSYCQSGNAGMQPPPTAATINSSGQFKAGTPSIAAMNLVKAVPLKTILTTMAAQIDTASAAAKVPPTCSATVSGMLSMIDSQNSFG